MRHQAKTAAEYMDAAHVAIEHLAWRYFEGVNDEGFIDHPKQTLVSLDDMLEADPLTEPSDAERARLYRIAAQWLLDLADADDPETP